METMPPANDGSPPRSDRVIAVVLLVALGLFSPVVSFLGLLLAMASDSCGASASCNADQIGNGIAIAALAPWVALIGGVGAVTAFSAVH